MLDELEVKVRSRDRLRTFHGQRIRDQLLAREAAEALRQAEAESLKDTNHRLAVRLLRRLAGQEREMDAQEMKALQESIAKALESGGAEYVDAMPFTPGEIPEICFELDGVGVYVTIGLV